MARKKWNHDWMFRDSNGRYRSKNPIIEDDYSEESGNRKYYKSGYPKFSTDRVTTENLNGPVIIVQEGRKKDGDV